MDILKQLAAGKKGSSASGGAAKGPKKYRRRGEIARERELAARAAAEGKEASSAAGSAAAQQKATGTGAASGAGGGAASGGAKGSHRGTGEGDSGAPSGAGAGSSAGQHATKASGTAGNGEGSAGGARGGAGADKDVGERALRPAEVTRRLRRAGQPIRLFGEEEAARIARLRKAEAELGEGVRDSDLMVGEGHEIGNVFLEQDRKRAKRAAEELGLDLMGDAAAGAGGEGKRRKRKRRGEDGEEERESRRPRETDSDEIYVMKYLKRLLREWEGDLARRPEAERRSLAGRNAAMMHAQCADYLKPFFKMCKTQQVPEEILKATRSIVDLMEAREYVKASDIYVRLAIGNAPWPLGVVSVGIHDRAARHKLHSNKVAHVLNDELQRKYITSIKRLMTYAQSKRPTDPSKMLL